MGGKAIKKVQISRIQKDDYEFIKKNIYELLSKDFQIDFLFELPEKNDFGDLDILYISQSDKSIKDYIIQYFNPNEIVSNGNVISFDYKLKDDILLTHLYEQNTKKDDIYFQIDLIKTSNLEMAKFYFSYGDIGSILGRIANYYNLVFGFDGLWLNLNVETVDKYLKNKKLSEEWINNMLKMKDKNNNENLGKIILTNKPNEICNYFDIDYEIWKKGFNKNEDIYKWIIKSKYFKKDIFYTLNRAHRERNEKRNFYNNFIKYILGEEEIKNGEFKININNQLNAIQYFRKEDELINLIENQKLKLERKDKFNAYIFKDLGIEDKELGKNIENFKNYINKKYNTTFEEWLDKNDKNDIINYIKDYLFL